MKNNPRPHCSTCSKDARGPIPNHRGGFFWACRACEQTWDLDGTPNPGTARARCTSLRDSALARIIIVMGCDRTEAEDFIRGYDLLQVHAQLDAITTPS